MSQNLASLLGCGLIGFAMIGCATNAVDDGTDAADPQLDGGKADGQNQALADFSSGTLDSWVFDQAVDKGSLDAAHASPRLSSSAAVQVWTTEFDMDDAVPEFTASSTLFRPVMIVVWPGCTGAARALGTHQSDGSWRAVVTADDLGAITCPANRPWDVHFKVYVTSTRDVEDQNAATHAHYTVASQNLE
jgi:hypothetical protein